MNAAHTKTHVSKEAKHNKSLYVHHACCAPKEVRAVSDAAYSAAYIVYVRIKSRVISSEPTYLRFGWNTPNAVCDAPI